VADSTVTRNHRGPFAYLLRVFAIGYLFLLVAWPVSLVATHTFANGFEALQTVFTTPDLVAALRLSALAAVAATVINTVFGVSISLLLVRTEFPGQRILGALLDLPLSVSPIVVGLALVLVYGPLNGWLGPALEARGISVIYATLGIVLATSFVSLPLVIREVIPVLREIGTEQEQAARSLGANEWQTFWRITLPGIRWAVVYGVVLTLARSLGEFGAVKVVSGNVSGQSRTAPLAVEEAYLNFNQEGAYALAFVLASVSVVCIIVVAILRRRSA
jgi:sulfate transport system permease protein